VCKQRRNRNRFEKKLGCHTLVADLPIPLLRRGKLEEEPGRELECILLVWISVSGRDWANYDRKQRNHYGGITGDETERGELRAARRRGDE
jgi:hypothetical protein